MNQIKYITKSDIPNSLKWKTIIDALWRGHQQDTASVSDQFIEHNSNTLLSRAAWVEGLGIGVKSVTVMPNNKALGLPSVQGAMLVFDVNTGSPKALIDNSVITYWKTAADSVLGARCLARKNATHLLILGAGVVAKSLVYAYSEMFPDLQQITLWNRTQSKALELQKQLSDQGFHINLCDDLALAVNQADIVSSATMSKQPIIRGEWVSKGTHIDLIGAFKSDMREADDDLLQKSKIYVDSKNTTIDHIGELKIPIDSGAISKRDVVGDLYDLAQGDVGRKNEDDITVFKNGGGAHLDLMTANQLLDICTPD